LSLLAAIRFLTVFPVIQSREFSAKEVGRSSAWFPLVGLLLGGLLVGMDALLEGHLEEPVINVLLIAAMVIMTGALHMDGFIDTCDSIFLRRPAEERLRIMADSRVGGYGLVGACCLILVKFAALGALHDEWRWIALLLMPVIGRWTMVCLLSFFRYARESGKGLVFKEQVDRLRVAIASLTALSVAVVFGGLGGLLVMAIVGLLILLFAVYLNHGLRGLTGDTYGAANELAEVFVLVLLPVIFDATDGGYIF
jgi:adenosylcobinamide-GDP ribazoletransferase